MKLEESERQIRYGIYDSRVGNALRGLTNDSKRLIHIPPGRANDRVYDMGVSDTQWAEDYQKLTWILIEIRNIFNERGRTYRVTDVEIALFMIGK